MVTKRAKAPLLAAVLVMGMSLVWRLSPAGGIEFPYTFKVSDEDYLFIHGQRIWGEVVCTWSEGEPLRMNGLQILPAPESDEGTPDPEHLDKLYREVPFVAALIDSEGVKSAEAWRRYEKRLSESTEAIWGAYWATYDSTGSESRARSEAEAAVEALGGGLFDSESPVRWANGCMEIPRFGRRAPLLLTEKWMKSGPMKRLPPNPAPDYDKAAHTVTSIEELLGTPGPSLYYIRSIGGSGGISHGPDVDKALDQIRNSTVENPRPGWFDEFGLKEILRAGTVEQ